MTDNEYKVQIELPNHKYNRSEQEQLISKINDEFEAEFSNDGEAEELADPAIVLALYSAMVSTFAFYLQLRTYLNDNHPAARINISHEGSGNIYVIDAEEANQVGATVLEQSGDEVLAEVSREEAKDLRNLDNESN